MATQTAEQQDAAKRMEADKKKLAAENEKRAADSAAHAKMVTGTPTPTQEEADLIKLGHHPELAPDGSTDPYSAKAMEPASSQHTGGGYQTRQTRAEHKPA